MDFLTTITEDRSMLVLSRTRGAETYLTLPDGRTCKVTVLDIDQGKVRLGFEFPPDVLIMRDDAAVRTPRTGKGA